MRALLLFMLPMAAWAQRFSEAPSLQMARVGAAVLTLDDAVVAISGENLEGPLRSVEILEAGSERWRGFARMRIPRVRHSATPLGEERILVAGGGGAARLAELWDSSTFVPAGTMLAARNRHSATLLADGRVLVIGGRDAREHPLASAELWDPKDNKWHPAGTLNDARCCHTATLLKDGRVLVVGGLTTGNCMPEEKGPCFHSTESVELWDPKTRRFSRGPSLPDNEDRAAHTATLLADGRVLIAGGNPDESGDYRYHDFLWDAGQWKTVEPGVGRAYHTATLLADGSVLVIGGAHSTCGCCKVVPGQGRLMGRAMRFNPVENAWRAAGDSPISRARHGAALLPDGSVIVVGGHSEEWGHRDEYFPGVERWSP